jgi:hypothetical protein
MESVLRANFPGKRKKLIAKFYKTRSLRHTIELKFRTITIRVAETVRPAPLECLRLLGYILIARLFRERVDNVVKSDYRSCLDKFILPNYQKRKYNVSKRYTPQGEYYNLGEMFDRLNHDYFNDELKKPILGWSVKNSKTRLGFYAKERDLLVISRIFDQPVVPVFVLESLLYHEMLHIYLPPVTKNGRRFIHTSEFRQHEKNFPKYEQANKWIKSYLTKL